MSNATIATIATVGTDGLTTFAPPAAATAETARCLNCDAPLAAPFCGICGQSAGVARLTLRSLIHEAVAQVVELDHGFVHTFIDLMKHPGETLRGFMRGRRRKYTGPIGFLLLATALSILQLATLPAEQRVFDAQMSAHDPVMVQAFGAARAARLVAVVHEVANSKFAMDLALIIPFMLLVRWLYRKRGINLAEAGTFTAYTLGAATIVATVASMPFYVFGAGQLGPAVSETGMGITALYMTMGFFGRSFSTIWRLAMVVLLGYLALGAALVIAVFIG